MLWLLPDNTKNIPSGGRGFGASRGGGDRKHAGIDLWARKGDPVLLPEAGTVTNIYPWPSRRSPSARAIMIHTESGKSILLAAVDPGSINAHIGHRFPEGHHIADVGVYPRGSTMLHLELYAGRRRRNRPWWADERKPDGLLDPRPYLERAARGEPDDDGGQSGGGGSSGDFEPPDENELPPAHEDDDETEGVSVKSKVIGLVLLLGGGLMLWRFG